MLAADIRGAVRKVLATHDIGVNDLACQRCHRLYRRIVETMVVCDVEPSNLMPPTDPEYRPDASARGRRASGYGYLDPSRRNLSWIRLACEPSLRAELIARSNADHVSLSEVVRRACRAYLGMPE